MQIFLKKISLNHNSTQHMAATVVVYASGAPPFEEIFYSAF